MNEERYDNNPVAYVADSEIHGRGLFARRRIQPEEYIGTYEGPDAEDDGMHVLWLWNEDTEEWEGIDGVNEMRFLNHSAEPNADWWGDELYALRAIEPDEEITFDYGWDDEDEEEEEGEEEA
ncbi:SET domain-containing protein [Wenzhouxiangella sediminis]|uniref:SET domain-containing protein n=1 Tax=Wenzhouxiangella sediminis TaxID=1792836 RepID=A0A3E1K557_9GAMM|nr:SET domain-containing protein [Wenzhouxiangella sediminis]RFF29078.1 SET domain-containing protein [Wenzhouxiangella sediminis]